ncbi:MAG: carboxylating nicotinate-nucleotide diphosphorylase [Verrucomicrobia bacterium]|nr:carboxylating nicotinate-nucleotide diphosphorylase [Verrucomicrobiota bacterium]
MKSIPAHEVRALVRAALAEDIGPGDATTLATVPARATAIAHMVAREPLVVAGLDCAVECFRALSPAVELKRHVSDGERANAGARLLTVRGRTRAILTAERVALNFVQRLSGIATLTAQFVEAVRGTGAAILDTRKTTPGLRRLEKHAVKCGGGRNHRLGLHDRVLIKDNHLAALRDAKPNAIAAAVARARAKWPGMVIEVEADTLAQVRQAVAANPHIILLDNMTLAQLRAAVRFVAGRARTEASGGANLRTVRAIAQTGVDFISVGALTHSARAVDLALDFES